jgi:hypothetical protein
MPGFAGRGPSLRRRSDSQLDKLPGAIHSLTKSKGHAAIHSLRGPCSFSNSRLVTAAVVVSEVEQIEQIRKRRRI